LEAFFGACLPGPVGRCNPAKMEQASRGFDVVRRVLEATTLFARLGLPNAAAESGLLKRQYRQLALLVHPDKCSHERAKEAFQKLSEAFDSLSDDGEQRRYLVELHGAHGGMAAEAAAVSSRRRRRRGAAARPEAADDGRWWNTQTWEEFEQRFRHRDAAEAALHVEFTRGVKAVHFAQRVRSQVRMAERSVEHCDRGAGFPESDLWPPASRLNAGAIEQVIEPQPGNDAMHQRPDLEHARDASSRLLELLTHLRTVHRYCLYCGCVFDSFEDLERNCPGFTEEVHERAPSIAARTDKERAFQPAGQVEVFEEDPLDSFMAGMQAQLSSDLKRSAESTMKRDQPQRGWSFQQQERQNNNAWKMAKRARRR